MSDMRRDLFKGGMKIGNFKFRISDFSLVSCHFLSATQKVTKKVTT